MTSVEMILEFTEHVTFSIVGLRESLPLGQRVDAFALDQWKDGAWVEFATGTSIGSCRLLRVPPLTTERIRLRIIKAAACLAISEIGIFAERRQSL